MGYQVIGGTVVYTPDINRLSTYAASIPKATSPLATPTQSYIGNFMTNTAYTGGGGTPDDGSGTPPAIINETSDGETGGESGGFTYEPISYAPIPLAQFPRELSAEVAARLAQEAQNYGDLAYAPAFSQAEQNLVDIDRQANTERELLGPAYWKSMQNTIASGANAVVRNMMNLNALGRLEGGEATRLTQETNANTTGALTNLETELNNRIYDVGKRETESEQDIGNLKLGLEKEKGLQVQVQKATLMKEALQQEISLRQMEFENRLAQAQDLRDWKQVELAYNEFKFNVDQLMYERTVTERQLAAELESTALSNQLLKSRLSGSGSTAATKDLIFDPITGQYVSQSQWQDNFWSDKDYQLKLLAANQPQVGLTAKEQYENALYGGLLKELNSAPAGGATNLVSGNFIGPFQQSNWGYGLK